MQHVHVELLLWRNRSWFVHAQQTNHHARCTCWTPLLPRWVIIHPKTQKMKKFKATSWSPSSPRYFAIFSNIANELSCKKIVLESFLTEPVCDLSPTQQRNHPSRRNEWTPSSPSCTMRTLQTRTSRWHSWSAVPQHARHSIQQYPTNCNQLSARCTHTHYSIPTHHQSERVHDAPECAQQLCALARLSQQHHIESVSMILSCLNHVHDSCQHGVALFLCTDFWIHRDVACFFFDEFRHAFSAVAGSPTFEHSKLNFHEASAYWESINVKWCAK